jgi:ABC-type polysaccharide/polyol phosphate export permease
MARDPAFGRFALLQAVRLSGTLIVLIGTMAASGNIPWLRAVPPWGALVLAGVGLTLFFGAPRWIVRRWKRDQ